MTSPFSTARAAPARGPDLIGFFRHHGAWAPGVRMFRRMGFGTKALIISAAFLLPLLALLCFLLTEASAQIAVARSEHQGLVYVRPVLDLIHVSQERRRAAVLGNGDLAGLQQRQAAAMAKLAAAEQAAGSAFGTKDAFQALKAQHEALQRTPVAASPDATFDAHSDFIAAALELIDVAANGSQLTLDPAMDTAQVMAMTVLHGPRQTENTAQVIALGTLALQTGDLGAARHDKMIQRAAVQRLLDSYVESAYLRGVAPDPQAAKDVDMQGTDAAFDAFLDTVKQQVMGSALQGTAETFLAAGTAVVGKQNEMNRKLFDRLDLRMQARIDSLHARMALQAGFCLLFVLLAAYLFYSFFLVTQGGLREVQKHLEAMTDGDLTTQPSPGAGTKPRT